MIFSRLSLISGKRPYFYFTENIDKFKIGLY